MPHIRKMSAAEIASLYHSDPSVRAELAAHYDALLAPFTIGDYGQAEPGALRDAAGGAGSECGGWMLDFVPTEGEALVFQVRAVAESAP